MPRARTIDVAHITQEKSRRLLMAAQMIANVDINDQARTVPSLQRPDHRGLGRAVRGAD